MTVVLFLDMFGDLQRQKDNFAEIGIMPEFEQLYFDLIKYNEMRHLLEYRQIFTKQLNEQ